MKRLCKTSGRMKTRINVPEVSLKLDEARVAEDSNGELLFTDSIVNTDAIVISSRSDWILVSGCSYHRCSNKSWFDTYEADYNGEVMMGDALVCRVEGTGTIKVKMHDGVVRTSGMVRYIPKLKKNLMSLNNFDKNGYSYKAKRGKLIISKGSLVVIKGEMISP
ncbi:unnamed protein product [Prunus armeniaca]